MEYVIIAWAEDNLPEIAGVWWNEKYDPDGLSAPRGGIFPRAQSMFCAYETSFAVVSDVVPDDESEDEVSQLTESI